MSRARPAALCAGLALACLSALPSTARADEGVQPWRGIADPQDVAVDGLAPGVVQTARQQATDQRPGRLAIEGSKLFDAVPHVRSIGRTVPAC